MSFYPIDNVAWFDDPWGRDRRRQHRHVRRLLEALSTTSGALVADLDALLNPVDPRCPMDPPIGAIPAVATVRG